MSELTESEVCVCVCMGASGWVCACVTWCVCCRIVVFTPTQLSTAAPFRVLREEEFASSLDDLGLVPQGALKICANS